MPKLTRPVLLAIAATVLVAVAAPPVSNLRGPVGQPLLPRSELVRVLGAGHLNFAADLYWMGMLQKLGYAHNPEDYRALYDYAKLIWELDDRFLANYRVAGLSIPFNLGREEWVNGAEALAVIDHGLSVFPGDVNLWLYRAHTCIFVLRDYPKGGESLRAAAKLPGAPPIAGLLATRVMAQAGEFDAALEFARVMAEGTADPAAKEYFERREGEIVLERILDRVDRASMQYWRREGSPPASVQVLVDAHDLDALPVDPLGGAIQLDAYGRARSSSTWFRLEVFDEDSKTMTPGGHGEAVPVPGLPEDQ